jgi:hypothetical protein
MSFRLKEGVFKVKCREPGCAFNSEFVVRENIMGATESDVDTEALRIACNLAYIKHDALYGRMHPLANPEVTKISGSYEHLGTGFEAPATVSAEKPWSAPPVASPALPAITAMEPESTRVARPEAPKKRAPRRSVKTSAKKAAIAKKKPVRKGKTSLKNIVAKRKPVARKKTAINKRPATKRKSASKTRTAAMRKPAARKKTTARKR